ncbi:hypothetical protein ATCC90586_004270 [Pythium insidiosum]|nr:hypothetical protein ATCC90586_004270 [Pythium insidiosum]
MAAALKHVDPKRVALVFTVLVSDLLFTGLIFGWAPLLLMLQEEQQYAELCDDTVPCVEQENRLNLIFAAASVAANIGALPFGVFLDYCGPKVAILLAAAMEISGLVLMALADSQSFDVFVPAYVLLAFGGSLTMMSSFPSSFLIMEHQTAILAAISCLFDGSSVVFLVLYSLRSTFGFARRELFLGLSFLSIFVFLALLVLWHLNENALSEDDEREGENTPLLPVMDHIESGEYKTLVAMELRKSEEDLKLVDQPLRKQVFTFQYGYVLVFAVVQVLRANMYIGTTNKLLENYGDKQHDFLFTKIFSLVLPLGFLFVPGIDYAVEHAGLPASLLITNCLGVAYNLLALIPSLVVQCAAFFLFTGFRAFLYAVSSAFAAKTFGLSNLGTLVGLIFSVSSVVSLLEYPAVFVSNAYFNGDLTFVNSIGLVLCALLFPYTAWYRRKEAARSKRLGALTRTSESEAIPLSVGAAPYLRSPCRKSPARLSVAPASGDSAI